MYDYKQNIKTRFKKALNTYDSNAFAQKKISLKLFDLIKDFSDKTKGNFFEIGCGTGFLTKKIFSELKPTISYVNDLLQECYDFFISEIENKQNIIFLKGNAEEINFPTDIDFIISGSTFQWFENPENFFRKSYNSLNENGLLIFNSFSPDNLKQIKELTAAGLSYFSKAEILNFSENYFDLLIVENETINLEFNSPFDVLRHLKLTGVNSFSSGLKTKNAIKIFEQEYYSKFKTENGVGLTYSPVYFVMRRK